MLNLTTQHKLGILQRLIVQQPVQFRPPCRGVAVFILNGDAVDGKGGTVREPGFHPVGVHIVAAGKQFCHNSILQDLIFGVRPLKPMPSSRWGIGRFCLSESKCTVSARILHGFKTCRGCKSLQNWIKGAEIAG